MKKSQHCIEPGKRGKKMKRFTKELASYRIKELEALQKEYGGDHSKHIAWIKQIITACEKGLITDREACYMFADPYGEHWESRSK